MEQLFTPAYTSSAVALTNQRRDVIRRHLTNAVYSLLGGLLLFGGIALVWVGSTATIVGGVVSGITGIVIALTRHNKSYDDLGKALQSTPLSTPDADRSA